MKKSKTSKKLKSVKQSPKVTIKFSSRPLKTRQNCSPLFRVSPKIVSVSENINLDQCYAGGDILSVPRYGRYKGIQSAHDWRKDYMD